jgi:voltage-gated potassium channel
MRAEDDLGSSGRPRVPSGGSSARGRHHQTVWTALGLLLPALLVLAYCWFPMHAFSPDHPARRWVALVCVLMVLAAATAAQIRVAIVAPLEHVLIGLPAVLALTVLVFAGIDAAIAESPGQFTGLASKLDAVYFAMATLTTVGFGDIHADGAQARAFVTVQMAYNVVILSAAIAAGTARAQRRADARHARRAPYGA